MFPWMNRFLFTENNFLPRLVKQSRYISLHCIFQSVYALNMFSIKIHREVLIKQ